MLNLTKMTVDREPQKYLSQSNRFAKHDTEKDSEARTSYFFIYSKVGIALQTQAAREAAKKKLNFIEN